MNNELSSGERLSWKISSVFIATFITFSLSLLFAVCHYGISNEHLPNLFGFIQTVC